MGVCTLLSWPTAGSKGQLLPCVGGGGGGLHFAQLTHSRRPRSEHFRVHQTEHLKSETVSSSSMVDQMQNYLMCKENCAWMWCSYQTETKLLFSIFTNYCLPSIEGVCWSLFFLTKLHLETIYLGHWRSGRKPFDTLAISKSNSNIKKTLRYHR